ncbi:MAG: hypothetical protein ABIV07_04585 [Polaromonas sp.]
MRMRQFLPLLAACWLMLLTACTSSAPTTRGEVKIAPMALPELAQSDINRMTTLAMRDNIESLLLIADKLYRRNPAEWRKTGLPSREAALARLRGAIDSGARWPELGEKRDIAALSLALGQDFAGDRVAAFTFASADMLITAHGGSRNFYLTDNLDAQYLYNAARNIEIAVWILSSRRNAAGQPLLLADEISGRERNLSFEREFGKLIGRLDLLSTVQTEKYRRAVVTYAHYLLGTAFLQFLPVR